MQELTPAGERELQNLAQRYGVSRDAVGALLAAVSAGGGTMAQFWISELGGGGQWMQGGMTMVGDMFNGRLQGIVSGLCAELSALLNSQQIFVPLPAREGPDGWIGSAGAWWPAQLGNPASSGGQNDARYAYFPHCQRLAIDRNGQVTVYDTLDHRIGGVQQQQGGSLGSLSFSSQYGTFTVESLPVAPSPAPQQPAREAQTQVATHQPEPRATKAAPGTYSAATRAPQSHEEILGALERLGQLHQKGILSDDEFRSKKAELLSRL
ncbi:MAG: SHOCT domain-containing protein [Polyangiaceae bacterium]